MKLLKRDEAPGRKYTALMYTFVLVFAGFIATHFLKIRIEAFEIYAKWIVIAMSVYGGANAGITGAAFIKDAIKKKNGGTHGT